MHWTEWVKAMTKGTVFTLAFVTLIIAIVIVVMSGVQGALWAVNKYTGEQKAHALSHEHLTEKQE